jgi:hypothetical protein
MGLAVLSCVIFLSTESASLARLSTLWGNVADSVTYAAFDDRAFSRDMPSLITVLAPFIRAVGSLVASFSTVVAFDVVSSWLRAGPGDVSSLVTIQTFNGLWAVDARLRTFPSNVSSLLAISTLDSYSAVWAFRLIRAFVS